MDGKNRIFKRFAESNLSTQEVLPSFPYVSSFILYTTCLTVHDSRTFKFDWKPVAQAHLTLINIP